MPWLEVNAMTERVRFVEEAASGRSTMAELCRQFGVSRQTGYKWLRRYRAFGEKGLVERPRAPVRIANRISPQTEARILKIRNDRRWGARKIRTVLLGQGVDAPAVSTIQQILQRNDQVDGPVARHAKVGRFEREFPNELWQMDFKGHFPMRMGGRCHPLTVLDDHSRFNLALRACGNEQLETVVRELSKVFQEYGLPDAMLMDNGPPWGDPQTRHTTRFEIWLLRLDIRPLHGRPRHPQTQGKEERFHRTLNEELLRHERFESLGPSQGIFDDYRQIYNWERPHQALGMDVPGQRYRSSDRQFPERLPDIEYPAGTVVRKVQALGRVHFRGREYRVPKAFRGERVAITPTENDGELGIFFGRHRIGTADLAYLNDG